MAGAPYTLWVSDGTEAGTQAVGELCNSVVGVNPGGLVLSGDRLYFRAFTDEAGMELWAMNIAGDAEGPAVSQVEVAPNPVPVNTPVSLSALIDDSATGGSVIAAATYTVAGTTGPMAAIDLAFDAAVEQVVTTLPAFTQAGVHNVCVTGTDTARIQVWYLDGFNNVTVFDNNQDQPLGSGSVKIHN